MLTLLAVVCLIILLVTLIWSVFGPPNESCGLRKGARYRVVRSFSSRDCEFREGEVVIFKRERRYRPWVVPDPWHEDPESPERDLYHFLEVETYRPRTISSANFPTIKEWVPFLDELDK